MVKTQYTVTIQDLIHRGTTGILIAPVPRLWMREGKARRFSDCYGWTKEDDVDTYLLLDVKQTTQGYAEVTVLAGTEVRTGEAFMSARVLVLRPGGPRSAYTVFVPKERASTFDIDPIPVDQVVLIMTSSTLILTEIRGLKPAGSVKFDARRVGEETASWIPRRFRGGA